MNSNRADISLRGAREHNLKNICVTFPRNQLTVITGLSGSGKSTLVFDTLYAEGQRRYVESLSVYARQFIEQLKKPDVDAIDGLSPPIAIEQRSIFRSPRSTVGTMTEIYDFVRLLFARIGKPHCTHCRIPITAQTADEMASRILQLPKGTFALLLAPVVRGKKGEFREEMALLRKSGFTRAIIDGSRVDLVHPPLLSKTSRHEIDVLIDQIELHPGILTRIREGIDIALGLTNGFLKVGILSEEKWRSSSKSLAFDQELFFSKHHACTRCGLNFPDIEPRLFSFNSPYGACEKCAGIGCAFCKGTRLREEARSILLAGRNVSELGEENIESLFSFFQTLSLTPREKTIAHLILKEIESRLQFLSDVGVGYLTLSRSSQTLSGGEAQRIRLATQLGSSLLGVIYVLDEPSIGLHARDELKLIQALQALRDRGNTVIVVEHDEMMMRNADYLIDMGPQGGAKGGYVVAAGTPAALIRNPQSLTGEYLSGKKRIEIPSTRRKGSGRELTLVGARSHNLKNLTVTLPLGTFICVTGISGSGKSSLVIDTLYPALVDHLRRHSRERSTELVYDASLHGDKLKSASVRGDTSLSSSPPLMGGDFTPKSGTFWGPRSREGDSDRNHSASAGILDDLKGAGYLDRVIYVDQTPIGKTPRSNPATYMGIFDLVRKLFSALPESRVRGFGPGRFSFNVKGGRCEKCRGAGVVKIEMHFLPEVHVPCDQCQGKRYHRDTLEVRYKGRNVAEILSLTIREALEVFANLFTIKRKVEILNEVGLGYLALGQPATTLSGGEAQRLKLAKELSKTGQGKSLYLLDEPTTGLHFRDIEQLLAILQRLVNEGNTVVVIEHQPDVIKSADYMIDLGPGGGPQGGEIVASGAPEEVAKCKRSPTGQLLAEIFR